MGKIINSIKFNLIAPICRRYRLIKDCYCGRQIVHAEESGLSCDIYVDEIWTYEQEHVPKCIEIKIGEKWNLYNTLYITLDGDVYYRPLQRMIKKKALEKIRLEEVKNFIKINNDLLSQTADCPDHGWETFMRNFVRYGK